MKDLTCNSQIRATYSLEDVAIHSGQIFYSLEVRGWNWEVGTSWHVGGGLGMVERCGSGDYFVVSHHV